MIKGKITIVEEQPISYNYGGYNDYDDDSPWMNYGNYYEKRVIKSKKSPEEKLKALKNLIDKDLQEAGFIKGAKVLVKLSKTKGTILDYLLDPICGYNEQTSNYEPLIVQFSLTNGHNYSNTYSMDELEIIKDISNANQTDAS